MLRTQNGRKFSPLLTPTQGSLLLLHVVSKRQVVLTQSFPLLRPFFSTHNRKRQKKETKKPIKKRELKGPDTQTHTTLIPYIFFDTLNSRQTQGEDTFWRHFFFGLIFDDDDDDDDVLRLCSLSFCIIDFVDPPKMSSSSPQQRERKPSQSSAKE